MKAYSLSSFDNLHDIEPKVPTEENNIGTTTPPSNDDIWTSEAIETFEEETRQALEELSGVNLAIYVNDVMKPRLEDINTELKRRRDSCGDDYIKQDYRTNNQDLLRHKSYMEGKILAEAKRSNIAIIIDTDTMLAPRTVQTMPPQIQSIATEPTSKWSLRGLKTRCRPAFNTAAIVAGAALGTICALATISTVFNRIETEESPFDNSLGTQIQWQEKAANAAKAKPPEWLIPQDPLQTMQEEASFAQKSIENWSITP